MSQNKKKHSWKFQGIISVISTALVLVMLGLVTLSVLTAREVAERVRENMVVTLVLNDGVSAPEAATLQSELRNRRYVNDIEYISAERALQEQTESMGIDPTDFLEFNPFSISMEVKVRSEYTSNDSLNWIADELSAMPQICEVAYPKDMVDNLNRNIGRVSLVLLGIAALLVLISISLIINMVRLTIFSHRFSIRTMKLVGAKWGFIRRPFLIRGLIIGLTSAVVAMIAIWGCVQALASYDDSLLNVITTPNMLITAIVVCACGLIITMLTTYICVTHYLRSHERDLY